MSSSSLGPTSGGGDYGDMLVPSEGSRDDGGGTLDDESLSSGDSKVHLVASGRILAGGEDSGTLLPARDSEGSLIGRAVSPVSSQTYDSELERKVHEDRRAVGHTEVIRRRQEENIAVRQSYRDALEFNQFKKELEGYSEDPTGIENLRPSIPHRGLSKAMRMEILMELKKVQELVYPVGISREEALAYKKEVSGKAYAAIKEIVARNRIEVAFIPHGKVSAGHGGTAEGFVLKDGIKTNLFFKPMDLVEYENLERIAYLSPELADSMPRVYGPMTVERNHYVVMEDISKGRGGRGEEIALDFVADAKLAGKVEGLDNPIANQDEMLITRGKTKKKFDYWQMKKGAEKAPDYMVAKGAKFVRFFNYGDSKTNLQASIARLSPQQRRNVLRDLHRLGALLRESPIAFIGASVVIVASPDKRHARAVLLDPAHMQVGAIGEVNLKAKLISEGKNPREVVEAPLKGVYVGDDRSFAKQKLSNLRAIEAMIHDIEELEAGS